jgi:site-specific recombinase XerD
MVLLQARLGLRATEVIAIQTEDINWRTGEILIRGKGQRHDRMPLPQDVGEVLANYIQQDRRTTSTTLFVAEHAPRKPLRDAQVLNEILKEAFIKTGLKPPTRYVGSHILRHSLAMKLMNRGASLPEVGDVLRHRSRPTTMIYAKVDIEGLRSIAQSWPVEGGVK